MVKKILMFLIGISVLVSVYVLIDRYRVEKENDNVEIAIDMTEFQDLAGKLGIDFGVLAQELKNTGVTSIGVQEVSLEELQNRGYIVFTLLSELIANYKNYNISAENNQIVESIISKFNQGLKPEEIKNYTVVVTRDKRIFDFIYNNLGARIKDGVIKIRDKTPYVLLIKKRVKDIEKKGIGFLEEDLKYAKNLDFLSIIPRIQNYQGISKEEIDMIIEQIKKYDVSTVVFAGDSVLGYNSDSKNQEVLKYAARNFVKKGLVAAIIEKPADQDVEKIQKGIKVFSKAADYKMTKVFSVDVNTQKQYDPKTIVQQWSRAIAERNARIIYIRPLGYSNNDPNQVRLDTLNAIRELDNRIKIMGYNKDIVKGLGRTHLNNYERIAIFIGILAGGLLLLLAFIKLNKYIIYGMLIMGIMGFAGIFVVDRLYNQFGDLAIKMAALAGAIIFPSLAALYLVNLYPKFLKERDKLTLAQIITRSIVITIISAGISLIGGLMVAGMLAENKYILKLDIFRGVKLAFIAPLLMYLMLFIKKIGIYSDPNNNPIDFSLQIKKLLNTSVTVKYVIIGLAILATVTVLLIRSGNVPSEFAIQAEQSFRSYLESIFIARPRTKELIAFPILMLLVYTYVKNYKSLSFFVMFAGIIGLADIVNSFCHIRMPVMMASLSTMYSLGFGIVVGSVVILLWNWFEGKFVGKRRESF